jgi:hypothetical protein
MLKLHAVRYCFVIILALLVAACGSGSTPAPAPLTKKTVSGVAAAGAPVSGTVYLKDSSTPRKELSAPIASDGSFSFDVTGLTMPCILKSVGSAGGQSAILYSLASGAGTANINPLSSVALRLSHPNGPDTLYAASDAADMIQTAIWFPTSVARLKLVLKPTLNLFNSAEADFVSDRFTANHMGLDLMFDLIDIATVGSNAATTVIFMDKTTGHSTTYLLNNLLEEWIDIRPVTPPFAAGSICTLPFAPVVSPNGVIALSAVVVGSLEQQVSWSVVGTGNGSISSQGIYTAPATPGVYIVKATTPSTSTTVPVTVRYPAPDPFTFRDRTVTSATSMSLVLSDEITITGDDPQGWLVSLSDSGPVPADLFIDDVFFVPGTVAPRIRPGQKLMIAQQPSPVVGGTSVTTVTVGGYSTTFTIRTVQ